MEGFAKTNRAGDPSGKTNQFDFLRAIIYAGYRFNDHIAARLTIANLFDTDPVFMASAVISNNTDSGMYDLFGRSYQLSVALRY